MENKHKFQLRASGIIYSRFQISPAHPLSTDQSEPCRFILKLVCRRTSAVFMWPLTYEPYAWRIVYQLSLRVTAAFLCIYPFVEICKCRTESSLKWPFMDRQLCAKWLKCPSPSQDTLREVGCWWWWWWAAAQFRLSLLFLGLQLVMILTDT